MRRPLTGFGLVVGAVLICTTAFGQGRDSDEASAPVKDCDKLADKAEMALCNSDKLFKEGRTLLDQGRTSEACGQFAKSNRLVPRRGGVVMNLGVCHEQEGKLLLARSELEEALAIARREGKSGRVEFTKKHLDAVEAALSWIHILPPANVPAAALELRLDDRVLPPEEWEKVPVEAGRHTVRASASGFVARSVPLNIRENMPQKISVPIGTLEPERLQPQRLESQRRGSPAPLRSVALITGITGFALSLAAGAWALERKGVVQSECNGDKVCTERGDDARAMGRMLVIGSTVAFAVGALGISGWLLLPEDSRRNGAHESGAGVVVGGAF